MFFRVAGSVAICLLLTRCSIAEERQDCPASACPKPHASLDLSPLQGTWQVVYFSESELGGRVPRFFNLSLCGSVDYAGPSKACQGSSVCYSELLDRYYSLGSTDSCQYSYSDRKVKMFYSYGADARNVYGHGNVTVTLVCGRSLGVPEVVAGDPSDDTVEILWITSAACKTDTPLAATNETKCYTVSASRDNGIKAKMIDLSNLIQTAGYEVTYSEKKDARFLVGVCRPIQSVQYPQCNGSMACLIQADPSFEIDKASLPLKLAFIYNASNLQIESDFPTMHFASRAPACDGDRKVKINYLCPSGNEDLGPTISYLDNKLCLVVVSWYTFYACGSDAIQSTGCTLTTATGLTFDLTGLGNNLTQVNGTSLNRNYTYAIQLCSGEKVNTQCGVLDSTGIRVAQIDFSNHGVCHTLGKGDGKLRYADGTLSLTYEMGDSCHSNFHRTSIINFVCPESVKKDSDTNQLRFLNEDNCLYEFEWTTPLACSSQTSGTQDCQFELGGNKYNFAPLMGESDKNWVAVDGVNDVECYMVNPCGELFVTEDSRSAAEYCNDRVAPQNGCVGCSVCQIRKDGGTKCIGTFDLQNSHSFSSVDKNVVTIQGNSSAKSDSSVAVMHYVCKTGDFSTPPVFVDITNDRFYEFHWMTMAACPLGIHVGDKCTVQHESTGYVFNVSSLSSTKYSYDDTTLYHYDVSVCKSLDSTCHQSSGAGACQTFDGHQRSMGKANSSLTYSDGTLFLRYSEGDSCSKGGKRNTTILFECDSAAHTPSIAAVNEVNHCEYAVELHTKLACPPAFRATECIHFDKGHTYDFSELAKSIGNWQAEDSHGSVYYINLCQPLNRIAGCSPLSAVCRAKTVGRKTEYTNLGMASSASFSVVEESGSEKKNRVVLTYTSEVTHDMCTKVYSRVEFICSPSAEAESGPVYQSGGNEDNPCEYSFTWETPGACPMHPNHSSSCSIRDPESQRLYDLSPLAEKNNHITVTSSDKKYSWNIALCGALNYTCHGSSKNVSVCQHYGDSQRTSGVQETRKLQFFDGSLSMRFTGGDKCSSNGRNRSTLINFECDRTVLIGQPRYIEEVNCEYSFEWPTLLACPHKELECVAGGGRYDLRPLLHYANYMVTTSGEYNIVVGGCSALDFESLPRCPQESGMGACMYPTAGAGRGEVMGYLLSDITEEVTGVLRLSYYNGAKCSNGRTRVVNIFFQCEKGAGVGVPAERGTDNTKCVTNIDWLTQYACPLDAANPSGWNITNPVTHQNFDLRHLSPSLTQIYTQNGDHYNYTIGLVGHQIACGSLGRDYKNGIGACQTNMDNGKSYILGRVSNNLQFVGEELRIEYRNGSFCHHVSAPRKAVLTFVCNRSAPASGYLEVLPEEECEYTFNIHTPTACKKRVGPSIECYVEGFSGLSTLTTLKVPPVQVPGGGIAYLAVCEAISADNQEDTKASSVCSDSAAACLVHDGKPVNLGVANSPPTVLKLGGGVVLEYSNGDVCKGQQKMKTTLILNCDKDTPIGIPELVVGSDECSYTFTWHSALACPVDIFNTNASEDVCSFRDPEGNSQFVFNSIASREVSVPNSDTKFYIQLCGTATTAHKECGSNVGVCRSNGKYAETLVHASHKFVILSHAPHVFEVVYDTGETCTGDRDWSAVVTLVCKWRGGTAQPVFQSSTDCTLRFVWKNSLFCVGHEMCAAEDKAGGYTYDLDGLLSDTWSGLVHGQEGRFELGVCHNINPFSPGPHCSSPAGICWHKSSTEHINLGHMTGPPMFIGGAYPHIQLNYSNGDDCSEGGPGQKHSTLISLTCGTGRSTPLTLESSGTCSHTLDWETPYACRPVVNYTTACVWNDSYSGLHYNLSSLATPVTIGGDDWSVEVCLCPSAACTTAGGAGVTAYIGSKSTKQIWGRFKELSVSTANSGPILTYTNGDVCRGSTTYKTVVYMECDRSITPESNKPYLQKAMSRSCTKVFFWSTPYACRSEHSSCTHIVDDKLYDFTPLQSNPGEKARKIHHSGNEYYLNPCGSIPDNTGCLPDTAVCLHSSKGEWLSIGMASTQQIITTSDKHLQIKFTGRQKCKDASSHVTIDMACGLAGLYFSSVKACQYEFTWSTPYACQVDDNVNVESQCKDIIKSSDTLSFLPKKLKNTDGFTVEGDLAHRTFYVSLCGHNSHCSQDTSVCYIDNIGETHDVASFTHQTIMTQGSLMWIEMNSTDGLSHAIVNVECVDRGGDLSRAETMEFEKVTTSVAATGSEKHTFYHFNMWTNAGCSFSKPTEAPPTSSPTNHHKSHNGDHSSGSSSSHSDSSSTVVGVLVTVLVLVIAAIVLGIVFYKKERRDKLLNMLKNKSSEPVKYEKLQMTRTEETALLEDSSSESGHGEGSGEEEEEDGEKTRHPACDETLINL